jgi:hypothetical protein
MLAVDGSKVEDGGGSSDARVVSLEGGHAKDNAVSAEAGEGNFERFNAWQWTW